MARRPSDKPVIFLRVVRGGFEPASAYDAEMHEGLRLGAEVEATIHERKSDQQARLFWRTLGIVAQNQDVYPDKESLCQALKIALGHVNAVTLIGGGVHVDPRSLSDFDRDGFSRFFDQSMALIAEEVIPGLDIETLLNEGRVAIGAQQ